MATFLDTVNRVLRINTVIGADDEDLTSFDDLQHVATLQVAKISIQSTLTELVSDRIIPYEETDGTIVTVTDQRAYSLPADFVRFKGVKPFLLKLDGSSNSENTTVNSYPGGEEALRRAVLDYREQAGEPTWFYEIEGTTKQIGLYQVPNSTNNGTTYRFPYEKSVYVTVAADTMPFVTQQESDQFADMAARRFQFLFTSQPIEGLERDSVYAAAKTSLMNLLRQTNPVRKYGYRYS